MSFAFGTNPVMATLVSQTMMIQGYLDRLQAGDESARHELIQCACGRLERLTRKMLHSWERVRRWEETDDVMQNALVRLYRSLSEVKPARTVDFFRLAALHIRRELHDLAKHYCGPHGIGANHATAAWRPASAGNAADSRVGSPARPTRTPRIWPLGPSSTARSHVCPKKNAKHLTCSGIRSCPKRKPPSCWGSLNEP